jgi:hypothetical protein
VGCDRKKVSPVPSGILVAIHPDYLLTFIENSDSLPANLRA